jgi:hypothetical protein
MSGQRAAGPAEDTTWAALLPELRVWTVTTGGPPDVAVPSRRQRFAVIRVVTATLQASRELRWQATIGGCCANATGLQKGAMG